MKIESITTLKSYIFSLVCVLSALAAQMFLNSVFGSPVPPFFFLYPAVFWVSWIGGIGPGLVSTALAGIGAWYIFIPPEGSFQIDSFKDSLVLVMFLMMGVFFSFLIPEAQKKRFALQLEPSERARRESDQRLRQALDYADAGTWEWDLATNKNIWSDNLWTMYGLKQDGRAPSFELWLQSIHPDDRAYAQANVAEAVRTSSVLNTEWRVIDANGQIRCLMARGKPFRNAINKIDRYIGFVLDITERKQLEKTLLENQQRTQLATETTGVGIWEWNVKNDSIWWDPQMFSIYGILPTEDGFVDYAIWAESVVQEDLAEQEEALRKHAREGGINRREFRLKRKDNGEIRVIQAVESIRTDSSGQTEWVVGTNFDVTESRRNEQALAAAKTEAEQANQAKSAFLANMSHEIRTPLGAIMGFSDLVINPEVEMSEKTTYVTAIRRNGELLSNIINDILDFSKVEAGKLEVVKHVVALDEVLADTRALLSLQAAEKGIMLNISVDANVPETICTDSMRLRQVLMNVIGNAIKFTSKGSIDVSISQAPRADGVGQLAFIIKDTGLGIASEQVQKLFSAFTQVDDSSKRGIGGTGLGLVLARRLSNLLGGDTVLTKTELGEGSTFIVTIDPGPTPAVMPEKPKSSGVVPDCDKIKRLDDVRVLLVDDSPDNQVLVSRMLRMAGANVEIAANGKEANEMALNQNYDVLLMDLQMPIMDGYEATAALRKIGYGGTIIALTAHAMAGEKQRCLEGGFDDHLSKPINRKILIERIESLSK
jgi:PAS domain S-box-containing protein